METIKVFNSILNSFKINAECVNYKRVDNYFYYDLKLNANVRVKDIQKISDELSLALKAPCKPSFKIMHQEGVVRLEFAQSRNEPTYLFDLMSNASFDSELSCLLGTKTDGTNLYMDLSKNPHMLIAGTTGSGKSTLLHNIIANLIVNNKSEIYLIDPKGIEFCLYDNKFDNVNVFYDYDVANFMISNLIDLMNSRYMMMRAGHKSSIFKPIVVIIDEFADLIMQDHDNSFYNGLCKLAQKCRAAKIHIILSTQRPSTNIINGVIKANFPARIACKVSSHTDSSVILDSTGAENLVGNGDALVKDNFRNLERFQVAYVSPEQILHYFNK